MEQTNNEHTPIPKEPHLSNEALIARAIQRFMSISQPPENEGEDSPKIQALFKRIDQVLRHELDVSLAQLYRETYGTSPMWVHERHSRTRHSMHFDALVNVQPQEVASLLRALEAQYEGLAMTVRTHLLHRAWRLHAMTR